MTRNLAMDNQAAADRNWQKFFDNAIFMSDDEESTGSDHHEEEEESWCSEDDEEESLGDDYLATLFHGSRNSEVESESPPGVAEDWNSDITSLFTLDDETIYTHITKRSQVLIENLPAPQRGDPDFLTHLTKVARAQGMNNHEMLLLVEKLIQETQRLGEDKQEEKRKQEVKPSPEAKEDVKQRSEDAEPSLLAEEKEVSCDEPETPTPTSNDLGSQEKWHDEDSEAIVVAEEEGQSLVGLSATLNEICNQSRSLKDDLQVEVEEELDDHSVFCYSETELPPHTFNIGKLVDSFCVASQVSEDNALPLQDCAVSLQHEDEEPEELEPESCAFEDTEEDAMESPKACTAAVTDLDAWVTSLEESFETAQPPQVPSLLRAEEQSPPAPPAVSHTVTPQPPVIKEVSKTPRRSLWNRVSKVASNIKKALGRPKCAQKNQSRFKSSSPVRPRRALMALSRAESYTSQETMDISSSSAYRQPDGPHLGHSRTPLPAVRELGFDTDYSV